MYLAIQSPEQFSNDLSDQSMEGHTHWLILLSDSHQSSLDAIVTALNARGLSFFGAVVPGLIQGRNHYHQGAVVKAVTCLGEPSVIQLEGRTPADSQGFPKLNGCQQQRRMLHLLVDCFSPDISGFLAQLFNHYGNSVNYFGGGAGTRGMQADRVIFTGQGVFSRAAVIAVLDSHGEVNVRHGWERVAGPFIASRTDKNIIREINWEPAIDLYNRILPPGLRNLKNGQLFARAAPSYPFGIQKEGREDVIRDPVRVTSSGELLCLSDVAENSVMYLEHGDPEKLIQAAADAVDELISDGRPPVECLVYDCYSRSRLLSDSFSRELERVAERIHAVAPGLVVEGAIVLGEISSDGERSLEFYNKTFVVNLAYE